MYGIIGVVVELVVGIIGSIAGNCDQLVAEGCGGLIVGNVVG